jgi:hypothetical protein
MYREGETTMKTLLALLLALVATDALAGIHGSRSEYPGRRSVTYYDSRSLANPYGAGSRYGNGPMNPYSPSGGYYSDRSWRNPYANNAPTLYQGGQYRGRWSTNRYNPDSTSNPYGYYGSPYSPYSTQNPYGAGSYYSRPIYVYPTR